MSMIFIIPKRWRDKTQHALAMDLLRKAYSKASDEESEPGYDQRAVPHPQFQHPNQVLRSLKRPRSEHPFPPSAPTQSNHSAPSSSPDGVALVPGRYVSKRERALLASLPCAADLSSTVSDLEPQPCAPIVLASISDSDLPREILSLLRHKAKTSAQSSKMPGRLSVALSSHTKAVNTIHWSQTDVHLLASAGMDCKICIWNVWSRNQKKVRVFSFHNAAVRDVKWSPRGLFVLSCGYDCSSRLIDVEKGIESQQFKDDQAIQVVKFHPDNPNLFLSGGSKGRLRLWDIRTGKVAHEYVRGLGPILDVEFTIGGKEFISSSDVSGANVSENSIIVWDISREVPLSNQVYSEAYTCTCIRHHPIDPYFVAQSNGNYVAIFSSSPPFRLDKYRRYESHGVSGFPIKCTFSMDGEKLLSGSSDGSIYLYDSKSTKLIKKIKAFTEACVDVACHPILPNVVAACCWNGDVLVFD